MASGEDTLYGCQTQQSPKPVSALSGGSGIIWMPSTLFSECSALAWIRQESSNDSYATISMGQQSLCQVSELASCGSIQDLIERTDQNSNDSLDGIDTAKGSGFWGNGSSGLPLQFIVLGNSIV